MLNARRRSFALPAITAAAMLLGSATASAAACPDTPTDLTTAGAPCQSTIGSRTPKLRAKVSDSDSQFLTADFAVRQGRTRVAELSATNVPSGSFAEVTLPNPLDDGVVYNWSVRVSDGKHHSKWVGCEFQVDATAPNTPTISSTDYPTGGFNGSPGRAGVFTFSPNGSTDVVRYGWSLNVDTFANRVEATNGTADVLITPTQAGPNSLHVRAYDKAGNSAVQTYVFLVRSESTPVAAWNFDETGGTTAADTTGNGHALTLNGATLGTGYSKNGQVNTASSFSATDSAIVDTSRQFSVSAWVKLDNANTTYTIASQDGDQGSGFALQYSVGPADVGVWNHLLGAYDPIAHKMSLYVNGKLKSTTDVTLTNASGAFVVGAGKSGGARVGQVAGTIDHVRVWDRSVSAAEAVKLSNFVVPRAFYSLDEMTGTTTKDEVSGQNGMLTGDAGWGSTPLDPDDPNQILGNRDKWLRFAASGTGELTGPRPATLRTDRSFTVAAWVRGTGGTAVTTGDGMFELGYRPDTGNWGFSVQHSGGRAEIQSDWPATTNGFTHLLATYDASTGTISLYVDATKQVEEIAGITPFDTTGALVAGRGLVGDLDEVRVYSGALAVQDVRDLYSATKHF
ncbi:MAG: hypothetical protein QOF58_6283 [Pseudonocardiales bacterium]|nr:hypothetical protein [Pseudonocardiales bacterium]